MHSAPHVPLFWEDSKTWIPTLEIVLPDIFNDEVTRRLVLDPPEYITTDDLQWLADLLPQHLSDAYNLRNEVLKSLRSHFTHLVAYHGCRPLDFNSYKERGIVPLDPAAAKRELLQRICEADVSGPTKEQLLLACKSTDASYREGRVFFEASRRLLLDFCGHYLLYGSEYAVGILRSISSTKDYAQILKLQGQPTLLTCEVPISWLKHATQEELAGSLIGAYFSEKLTPDYVHPSNGMGFGFEIFRSLPPALIVQVDRLDFVRDPISGY